ncbi:MAG: hypothetical protein ABI162_10180 [Luteolibacter sp.]
MTSDLVINPWPYQPKQKAPRLILFDTTHPEAPEAEEPVALGPEGSSFTRASKAADGLAVLGVSYPVNSKAGDGQFQAARVIEVAESGTPIVRPLIELPGELDSNGFLAFTRNVRDEKTSPSTSARAMDTRRSKSPVFPSQYGGCFRFRTVPENRLAAGLPALDSRTFDRFVRGLAFHGG